MSAATPVVSGDRQECVDVSVHGPASLSAARMERRGTLDMMLLGIFSRSQNVRGLLGDGFEEFRIPADGRGGQVRQVSD